MARLVDILIVDDRAVLIVDDRTVAADVTILAFQYSAPGATALRLKHGAALLSLFGLDQFAGHSLVREPRRSLCDGRALGF